MEEIVGKSESYWKFGRRILSYHLQRPKYGFTMIRKSSLLGFSLENEH